MERSILGGRSRFESPILRVTLHGPRPDVWSRPHISLSIEAPKMERSIRHRLVRVQRWAAGSPVRRGHYGVHRPSGSAPRFLNALEIFDGPGHQPRRALEVFDGPGHQPKRGLETFDGPGHQPRWALETFDGPGHQPRWALETFDGPGHQPK